MKKILFYTSFILYACITKAQVCIPVITTCSNTTSYCFDCKASKCGPYELSSGIYRIPFANGTKITVVGDHFNHCPRGRIDIAGIEGNGLYKIVVAADGWIRAIEDDNNIQCDCSVTSCGNNYVWIEHPNGEWTKYTHMQQYSVTNLGHYVGQWVTAGTYLGDEGNVGCAAGYHLHFEVAQPVDTNTLVFSEYGGYIDLNWAKNLIPVMCFPGLPGHVFVQGAELTANNCSECYFSNISASAQTFNAGGYQVLLSSDIVSTSGNIVFKQYASGLYQAGNYVKLTSGFEVKNGAAFTARLKNCSDNIKEQNNVIAEKNTIVPNIKNEKAKEIFTLYPNPASGIITAEWQMVEKRSCRLIVTDITGRVLKEIMPLQQVNPGKRQVQFSAQNFANGTYFVHLFAGDKNYVKKLQVQH